MNTHNLISTAFRVKCTNTHYVYLLTYEVMCTACLRSSSFHELSLMLAALAPDYMQYTIYLVALPRIS